MKEAELILRRARGKGRSGTQSFLAEFPVREEEPGRELPAQVLKSWRTLMHLNLPTAYYRQSAGQHQLHLFDTFSQEMPAGAVDLTEGTPYLSVASDYERSPASIAAGAQPTHSFFPPPPDDATKNGKRPFTRMKLRTLNV